jgi:hypothetical protein
MVCWCYHIASRGLSLQHKHHGATRRVRAGPVLGTTRLWMAVSLQPLYVRRLMFPGC